MKLQIEIYYASPFFFSQASLERLLTETIDSKLQALLNEC